jgi:hypothetical protein
MHRPQTYIVSMDDSVCLILYSLNYQTVLRTDNTGKYYKEAYYCKKVFHPFLRFNPYFTCYLAIESIAIPYASTPVIKYSTTGVSSVRLILFIPDLCRGFAR